MKQTRQFGGKYRVFLPEGLLEQLPDTNNDRLSEDQQDVIQVMREGFNTLSDMQKRVIMLMVDQNMSERKVAKVLGIGYPTVLNHLNRARKKLKEYVMQNLDSCNISENSIKEKSRNEAAKSRTADCNDSNEDN